MTTARIPALDFEPKGKQIEAKNLLAEWVMGGDPLFKLGGFAGSGKTTLVASLAKTGMFGKCAMLAPTNKAAEVLRRKRIDATTCHSFLYGQAMGGGGSAKASDVIKELDRATADEGADSLAAAELRKKLSKLAEDSGMLFVPRGAQDFDPETLIVDEASMLGTDIMADLESRATRILLVGDPGQLPPVKREAAFRDPDFTLTEVHRIEPGCEDLANLTMDLRTTARFPLNVHDHDGSVEVVSDFDFTYWKKLGYPPVLCHQNKTRHAYNVRARARLGHDSPYPQVGEPMIGVSSWGGVVNGYSYVVRECTPPTSRYDRRVGLYLGQADGGPGTYVETAALFFEELHRSPQNRAIAQMPKAVDFAYAITVHKSQGSEWPCVVVNDDFTMKQNAKQYRQWLYTACTRAQSKLVYRPGS